MKEVGNCKMLLTRMDRAFSDYFNQAEELSVLLAEPRDPSSWTWYDGLLKKRTAELVAYEKYCCLKEELFRLINPPSGPHRPESSFS